MVTNMANVIVCTGRGGAGKSTFAALAVRHLKSPPLLIDADPDQSLAQLLGVDLATAGVNTISDVLYKLQKPDAYDELGSMRLAEKIEYLLNLSCLYESPQFDLITLGVKWTRGCYCAPNDVLQSILPGLAQDYKYAIVDSPAGLEHMNRRIVSKVDDVFVLIDPSTKAMRNAERLREIAEVIGVTYKNLYLVGNYRFSAEAEQRRGELNGATYLGRVEPDEDVERFDREGRSLLELPEGSPASRSVGRILAKAGYATA
jgi:CO dehydrogenase maturation factor